MEMDKLNSVLFECSGRHSEMINEVRDYNRKKDPERLSEECAWSWTNTSHEPPFLISDDVSISEFS